MNKWTVLLIGMVLACLYLVGYSFHGTREARQVLTAATDKNSPEFEKESLNTTGAGNGAVLTRIELQSVRETKATSNDNASRYIGYGGRRRYIIEADDDCLIQSPEDTRQALTVLKKKGLSDEAGHKLGRELLESASQPIFLLHYSKTGWRLVQGKESCEAIVEQ
jgi:hypothetical protein